MADDIVERLYCSYADPPCEQCTFCAARAEIERLRVELKAVADVLYRRADGARKMDNGRRQLEIWGVPESFIAWMLREGEEARRG